VQNIGPGWVTTVCWRDGGTDGSTTRWSRVIANGVQGWVNLSYIDSSHQASVPYCWDLKPNEALFPGEAVWSSGGRYELIMQGDGNLVEYGPSGARWASNTSGNNWAIMQGDGNLVVYRSGGGAMWSSGTAGFGGTYLAVQDDGNVVEYAPGYGAIWAASWHENAGARSGVNAAWQDPSQCTWYALEQWKNYTGEHNYPAFKYGANAGGWVQAINGWPAYRNPMTGSMVIWTGNPGHVGWVLAIYPDGRGGMNILVTERNYDLRGSTRTQWQHADPGLWYIPAPAL
jgi:hypothetical protein